MSTRCKACDGFLDSKDTEYCSKCLQLIWKYQTENIVDSFLSDEEIIEEVVSHERATSKIPI